MELSREELFSIFEKILREIGAIKIKKDLGAGFFYFTLNNKNFLGQPRHDGRVYLIVPNGLEKKYSKDKNLEKELAKKLTFTISKFNVNKVKISAIKLPTKKLKLKEWLEINH